MAFEHIGAIADRLVAETLKKQAEREEAGKK